MSEIKQKIESNSMEKKPDSFVFIIGAMKSGTTSLFDILSQHTQICPSKVKEPDYFTKPGNAQSRDIYLDLWDWKAGIHRFAMESSVAYTKAPHIPGVPENIHNSGLGSYRFIYMVRNPISRIESQVRHGVFAGWGKSLDEGITEDLLNFSRYAMQIKNYLQYFPKENILVIPLEEFQAEPNRVLKRICHFLNIDPDFQFSRVDEPRNSGTFFNTPPTVARLTQGKLGRLIARKLLPAWFKNWLRKKIANLGKNKQQSNNLGRWKLNEEERATILNKLASDIKILQEEFNVDVQKFWKLSPDFLERN